MSDKSMTVSELFEIIDNMRTVYDFDDKETIITTMDFVPNPVGDLVCVHTKDKNGVEIDMRKSVETHRKLKEKQEN